LQKLKHQHYMKQILKKPLGVARIFGLLLATNLGLNAQTVTVQIGSGTSTGSQIPVASGYDYTYSQQIVTAAEFAAGNGAAGNITKIRWRFTNIGNTTNYGNWDVWIGHTTKTAFTSNADWVPIGDLTQVFSGNIHLLTIPPTANQWFEIEFSSPFNYNGTDNIVVAVNEKTIGYSSVPTKLSYTSGQSTGIYARKDGDSGAFYNPANPPSASTRTNNLAQLQFERQQVPCLPPTGISFTQNSLTGSGTQINGITTNSTSVTTVVDTNYEFYVRQNCGVEGESIWIGPFSFKTEYCTPAYTLGCFNGSKIANFEINDAIIDLANNTGTASCGANGNNNFTSMSATASEGFQPSFVVQVGSFSAGVKLWIDWNNNGFFEASEIVGESSSTISSGSTFTGTITVPTGTPIGNYRLRVMVVEGTTTFNACSSQNYGEAEDYTFKVVTPPPCLPPLDLTLEAERK